MKMCAANLLNLRRELANPQSGFALVVVLLLITALSLVGVASLRSTSLQERMAGNLYFKSLSMQDAEAALRSTAARMESKLGAQVAVVPATASTDANWRNFNADSATQSHLRSATAWTDTRALTSVARGSSTVNAVTESFGVSRLTGCDVNVRPGACLFRFTRMSSKSTDSVTGASSIVQQYWTFQN
jgi:type IV pilus assembly protein PilX